MTERQKKLLSIVLLFNIIILLLILVSLHTRIGVNGRAYLSSLKYDNLVQLSDNKIVDYQLSLYVATEGVKEPIKYLMLNTEDGINEELILNQVIEQTKGSSQQDFKMITINNLDDIAHLREYQDYLIENNYTSTQIIVVDNIQDEDLTILLNTINVLYYDSAISMPNVTYIIQVKRLGLVDYRLTQVYEDILSQDWITSDIQEVNNNVGYRFTELSETYLLSEDLNIAIALKDDDIEYVHYRLNDVVVGVSHRYPYNLNIMWEDIEDINNELKIAIKYLGEDRVREQYFYFIKELVNLETAVRAPRADFSYNVGENMSYNTSYIPVLMYHDFGDVVASKEESIKVSTQLFDEQIGYLLECGYVPITFKILKDYFDGVGGLPEKPIIITTDDGYLSNYLIAYPILEKYNVPATFFISTAYVGDLDTITPHFSWEEAQQMENSGLIDIQSHTHTHLLMNEIDIVEAEYQVNYSFELIENNLGARDVKVLAYPKLGYSRETSDLLEAIGVDIQVTDLNIGGNVTELIDVKRIHIPNTMSKEELVQTIKELTE